MKCALNKICLSKQSKFILSYYTPNLARNTVPTHTIHGGRDIVNKPKYSSVVPNISMHGLIFLLPQGIQVSEKTGRKIIC